MTCAHRIPQGRPRMWSGGYDASLCCGCVSCLVAPLNALGGDLSLSKRDSLSQYLYHTEISPKLLCAATSMDGLMCWFFCYNGECVLFAVSGLQKLIEATVSL